MRSMESKVLGEGLGARKVRPSKFEELNFWERDRDTLTSPQK
jgi:hypothetical protein